MRFKLQSIDDEVRRQVAKGRASFSGEGLTFFGQDAFDGEVRSDTFLDREGMNAEVIAAIADRGGSANGLYTGVAVFENVLLLAPLGLILDPDRKVAWKGALLNWNPQAIRNKLREYFMPGSDELEIDVGPPASTSNIAALIAAPGYNIYGHWILDFLPRISRFREFTDDQLPVYREAPRPWASQLASVLLPEWPDRAIANAGQSLRVKQLIVPTISTVRGLLEGKSCVRAWTALSDRLAASHENIGDQPKSDRVYISRRNWYKLGDDRILQNAAEVEDRFEAAGFSIVSPEKMSFNQQQAMFSNARAIAGEDGSGMHNSIFSAPGTRVGLLAMGRINTLHTSIANALRQHITYVDTEKTENKGIYTANIKAVDRMIEQLVS